MTLLAGLLDVLFRAFAFVGLALAVGGILFRYLVLRPVTHALSLDSSATAAASVRRTASLTAAGALLVAIFYALVLVVAPWSLAEESGDWPGVQALAPARARKGRHGAILLPFRALLAALESAR